MEKVKVKSVIDSSRRWEGKIIYTVELEDGRKGDSFNQDAIGWIGKEVELDVTEKDYQGQKQYRFSQKPSGKPGFPQKDYTFEKRRTSLECAINSIRLTEGKVSSTNIIALSEEFFTYLNKK